MYTFFFRNMYICNLSTIHSKFNKPLFGGSPIFWFINNLAFSEINRALKKINILLQFRTQSHSCENFRLFYIIFKPLFIERCIVIRHTCLVYFFRIIHDCIVCLFFHTHKLNTEMNEESTSKLTT